MMKIESLVNQAAPSPRQRPKKKNTEAFYSLVFDLNVLVLLYRVLQQWLYTLRLLPEMHNISNWFYYVMHSKRWLNF